MKIVAVLLSILLLASISYAQQSPFKKLKQHFKGNEEVVSISASGMLARMVLNFADEDPLRKAIKEVKRIRIITIPHAAIATSNFNATSFRNEATAHLESVLNIRNDDNTISIFSKTGKKKKNNGYFLMVEGSDELVAIELKGSIDIDVLLKDENLVLLK